MLRKCPKVKLLPLHCWLYLPSCFIKSFILDTVMCHGEKGLHDDTGLRRNTCCLNVRVFVMTWTVTEGAHADTSSTSVLWCVDEPWNSHWALACCCFHWKGPDYFQIYLNTVSAYTITKLRCVLSFLLSLTGMKWWIRGAISLWTLRRAITVILLNLEEWLNCDAKSYLQAETCHQPASYVCSAVMFLHCRKMKNKLWLRDMREFPQWRENDFFFNSIWMMITTSLPCCFLHPSISYSTFHIHIQLACAECSKLTKLYGRFHVLVSLLPISCSVHISLLDAECFRRETESRRCYPHHISPFSLRTCLMRAAFQFKEKPFGLQMGLDNVPYKLVCLEHGQSSICLVSPLHQHLRCAPATAHLKLIQGLHL